MVVLSRKECSTGHLQVKLHPFFSGLEWNAIQQRRANPSTAQGGKAAEETAWLHPR